MQAEQRCHLDSPEPKGAKSNGQTCRRAVSLKSKAWHMWATSMIPRQLLMCREEVGKRETRQTERGSSSQLQLLCSMQYFSQSHGVLQACRALQHPIMKQFPQWLLPPQSSSLFLPGLFPWYSRVMAEPHASITLSNNFWLTPISFVSTVK